MPRVCIDCRYIGPRPSGIAELVQALIDHCPLIAPDFEFLLLKHPAKREALSPAANVTEVVVRTGANHPLSMWLLPELAPLRSVDLFHSPHNILPARIAAKTVTTVHDIMWLTRPNWCDASAVALPKRLFFQHGIRRALQRSDRIAVVSAATRKAILDLAPELAERIEVTRSGVSHRFKPVQPSPMTLRSAGLPEGAAYVLVVGQFAPYKNHEGALRAFQKALGTCEDAHCVFVQRQGSGRDTLGKLAADLGISDRVHFHHQVSEDDLIQLYGGARVLLHPSLCEGFGNPVAEAMACGCPVITSDRSAMPEVTGGAAALVDPLSVNAITASLREIWHDEERRGQMASAGIERAKALDWTDFARANLAIYRSLLASN